MSWTPVRAAALAAALVLGALARGDVLVLAALLALGAWRPLPAIAVVSALPGTGWRWSSTALEHISGAQAVLGPAGLVDPSTAAASAWCAAAAVVLAAPDLRLAWFSEWSRRRAETHADAAQDPVAPPALFRRLDLGDGEGGRAAVAVARWLPRLAHAVVAGAVVAGPAATEDGWIRAIGVIGSLVVIVLLDRLPGRHRRLRAVAAVVAGGASLVLVAADSPPVEGVLDGAALREGAALAVALGVLAWAVGAALVNAPRLRRPAAA